MLNIYSSKKKERLTEALGNKSDCPNFEGCSASLCPLAPNLKDLIWYPQEEICHRRNVPDWVRKQRAIVKVRAPSDRYFTVDMLEALKQVRKGIEGINPDQPLEQAKEAERKWIARHKATRVIANQAEKPSRVVAKKRDNLVLATSTSYQDRGGEK